MSTFTLVAPETATGRAQELLAAVKTQLGRVPNMMLAMATAPATLDAYLQMSAALAKGALPTKTRELIALTVGQASECGYCLAAHSTLGKAAGLAPEQMLAARNGRSEDVSTSALLHFAAVVVEKRGRVLATDLAVLRSAGFGDSAIAEVVANVALNLFTNYFNHVTEVAVDFAAAPPLAAVPAPVAIGTTFPPLVAAAVAVS